MTTFNLKKETKVPSPCQVPSQCQVPSPMSSLDDFVCGDFVCGGFDEAVAEVYAEAVGGADVRCGADGVSVRSGYEAVSS